MIIKLIPKQHFVRLQEQQIHQVGIRRFFRSCQRRGCAHLVAVDAKSADALGDLPRLHCG